MVFNNSNDCAFFVLFTNMMEMLQLFGRYFISRCYVSVACQLLIAASTYYTVLFPNYPCLQLPLGCCCLMKVCGNPSACSSSALSPGQETLRSLLSLPIILKLRALWSHHITTLDCFHLLKNHHLNVFWLVTFTFNLISSLHLLLCISHNFRSIKGNILHFTET